MLRRIVLLALSGLLITLALAAWTLDSGDNFAGLAQPAHQDDLTPTAEALPGRSLIGDDALQQTATPGTPTPQKMTVRVWWPDELYPQQPGAALDTLLSQFEGFELTYSTYDLDLRRKRTNGLGGILSTLRTAQPVASGALPDLTLMRRSDMITAADEGLIVPLTDWVPTDLVGTNLLSGALELGQIDGVLYGLPYAVNLVHILYRTSVFLQPPASFADVLAENTHYLFPGGLTPVSWTVLLQYWSAGGRLVDASGVPVLDREPLVAVLDYYAQGLAQGIFSPDLLTYTSYDALWSQFDAGAANVLTIDTQSYLASASDLTNVSFSAIPTLNGDPVTMLDGWLWVLTTTNPEHQQRARAFLSWMMRISQQSLFTEALGILPSQDRALRLWDNEEYATFARQLSASAVLIPEAQRNNAAAVALQQSLADVLSGATPDAAADAALARLNGS